MKKLILVARRTSGRARGNVVKPWLGGLTGQHDDILPLKTGENLDKNDENRRKIGGKEPFGPRFSPVIGPRPEVRVSCFCGACHW